MIDPVLLLSFGVFGAGIIQFLAIKVLDNRNIYRIYKTQPIVLGMATGDETPEAKEVHRWSDRKRRIIKRITPDDLGEAGPGLIDWLLAGLCWLGTIVITGFLLVLGFIFVRNLISYFGTTNNLALCFYFSLAFSMILIVTHFLAYVFGGKLHQRFSKSWPKYIDFLYYIFGAAFVFIAIKEISAPNDIVKVSPFQAISALVLFGLKLTKTSAELFDFFNPEGADYYRGIGGRLKTLRTKNTNGA